MPEISAHGPFRRRLGSKFIGETAPEVVSDPVRSREKMVDVIPKSDVARVFFGMAQRH